MKEITFITFNKIRLWHRGGFMSLRVEIHPDFEKWHTKERVLLKVMSVLEKKKKLPKMKKRLICEAMALSHRNCSEAFAIRQRTAVVMDIDSIINKLL